MRDPGSRPRPAGGAGPPPRAGDAPVTGREWGNAGIGECGRFGVRRGEDAQIGVERGAQGSRCAGTAVRGITGCRESGVRGVLGCRESSLWNNGVQRERGVRCFGVQGERGARYMGVHK